MTALREYDRLESTGVWRESPEAQRRDVVVGFGRNTLVISDVNGGPLSHWSLPAVVRLTKGAGPAEYAPDMSAAETLEISEPEMIEALDRVLRVIKSRRPRPGRLRILAFSSIVFAATWFGVFVMPAQVVSHTLAILPQVKRSEIGQRLLGDIETLSGVICEGNDTDPILARLHRRLVAGDIGGIRVLRSNRPRSMSLPGGLVLASRGLIEDYEGPEVLAGYVIAETLRSTANDPMRDLLNFAGLTATFRLLTTGNMNPEILRSYAEILLTEVPDPLNSETLIAAFDKARVRSTPFAYALDISGEATLPLIEGDPLRGQLAQPLMPDSDWVQLQDICSIS